MSRSKVHQSYIKEDGTKVPSVTQIIGLNLGWGTNALLGWTRAKMKQGIDPIRLRDFAGEVGTICHGLIEQYFTGEVFNVYEYPADALTGAQVAFAGFESFLAANHMKMVYSEVPVVHEEMGFGGTLDWVGELNKEDACLVDFKTSSNIYPSHIIQLAAYRELYRAKYGVLLKKAHILHLDKTTGNHDLKTITNFEPYWDTFCLLLGLQQQYEIIG